MKSPLVAIVGAPNVGKSRLFNRLTGRQSIVHDRPGVTRDRLVGPCEWSGNRIRVMDTGGWIPGDRDELTGSVERQVLKGIRESALLLFLVDGRAGLTPLDQSLASLFRRSGRPILLTVNKVDSESQEGRLADFLSLGFPDPVPVSAEEGRGLGTLLDRILEMLPGQPAAHPPATSSPSFLNLALVGRPNVGKSTLFNRLAGEERALVSPVPGTTRDPVDAEFSHAGRRYRIVDTAGLRRKGRARGEEVEAQSIQRALSAMKQADLVLVLLDAREPATHQDLAVIGACQKVRRPFAVAVNKTDLLTPSARDRRSLERGIRERLRFAPESPVIPLSALAGEGIRDLLRTLDRMAAESIRSVPTPDLNRALEEAVKRRSPSGKDRIPRFYYAAQTGTCPPSFVVFTNGAPVDASYRRYLGRQLALALGFTLVPLSLRFRSRARQSP
jgi:GTP-binding protein